MFLTRVFGRKKSGDKDSQSHPSSESSSSSPLEGKFEYVVPSPVGKGPSYPHLSLNLPARREINALNNVFGNDETIGKKRLTPEETLTIVRACSKAIIARGLETLGIMHPHWHSASPATQQRLILLFVQSSAAVFESEINSTRSPHDVAAVLRWAFRHLQLTGTSFGNDPAWYRNFFEAEQSASYPPKSFSEILAPQLPTINLELLTTTLDLFSSLAAHSEANSVSGSKLSKLLGLWLLTADRSAPGEEFIAFYDQWDRQGRILEHLFLSHIRNEVANHRMPKRLVELVKHYPYTKHGQPSPNHDLLPRPRFSTRRYDALFVHIDTEVPPSGARPEKLSLQMVADALNAINPTSLDSAPYTVWRKVQQAGQVGEDEPLYTSTSGKYPGLNRILSDDTLRILSLLADDDSKPSSSVDFLSRDSSHNGSPELSRTSSSHARQLSVSSDTPTATAHPPPSANSVGLDWASFSTSGFLESNPPLQERSLAATLMDKDTEITVPGSSPSRKASKKSRVPIYQSRRSLDTLPPISIPPLGITGSQLHNGASASNGNSKLKSRVTKIELIPLDEAFIDCWNDSVVDPITSIEAWPRFVICRLKTSVVPELDVDAASEGARKKKVEWLVVEQGYVDPAPPAVSPGAQSAVTSGEGTTETGPAATAESATSPKSPSQLRASSPRPSVSSINASVKRFSFWSKKEKGSRADKDESSPTKSKKKGKGLKVGEMGELTKEEEEEASKGKIEVPAPVKEEKEEKDVKKSEAKDGDSVPTATIAAVATGVVAAGAAAVVSEAATKAEKSEAPKDQNQPQIPVVEGDLSPEVADANVEPAKVEPLPADNLTAGATVPEPTSLETQAEPLETEPHPSTNVAEPTHSEEVQNIEKENAEVVHEKTTPVVENEPDSTQSVLLQPPEPEIEAKDAQETGREEKLAEEALAAAAAVESKELEPTGGDGDDELQPSQGVAIEALQPEELEEPIVSSDAPIPSHTHVDEPSTATPEEAEASADTLDVVAADSTPILEAAPMVEPISASVAHIADAEEVAEPEQEPVTLDNNTAEVISGEPSVEPEVAPIEPEVIPVSHVDMEPSSEEEAPTVQAVMEEVSEPPAEHEEAVIEETAPAGAVVESTPLGAAEEEPIRGELVTLDKSIAERLESVEEGEAPDVVLHDDLVPDEPSVEPEMGSSVHDTIPASHVEMNPPIDEDNPSEAPLEASPVADAATEVLDPVAGNEEVTIEGTAPSASENVADATLDAAAGEATMDQEPETIDNSIAEGVEQVEASSDDVLPDDLVSDEPSVEHEARDEPISVSIEENVPTEEEAIPEQEPVVLEETSVEPTESLNEESVIEGNAPTEEEAISEQEPVTVEEISAKPTEGFDEEAVMEESAPAEEEAIPEQESVALGEMSAEPTESFDEEHVVEANALTEEETIPEQEHVALEEAVQPTHDDEETAPAAVSVSDVAEEPGSSPELATQIEDSAPAEHDTMEPRVADSEPAVHSEPLRDPSPGHEEDAVSIPEVPVVEAPIIPPVSPQLTALDDVAELTEQNATQALDIDQLPENHLPAAPESVVLSGETPGPQLALSSNEAATAALTSSPEDSSSGIETSTHEKVEGTDQAVEEEAAPVDVAEAAELSQPPQNDTKTQPLETVDSQADEPSA